MRPTAAVLVAALLLSGLLAGCQGKVQRPVCPAGKVCLEYGNNSEPLTLDPQKSNLIDEFTIIADLIVGMTTDAPDASPIPAMATSWETSPDGLTWTFHMRDAVWSDGVPVTADDFISVIFTVTPDLHSEFPAVAARTATNRSSAGAMSFSKIACCSLGAMPTPWSATASRT